MRNAGVTHLDKVEICQVNSGAISARAEIGLLCSEVYGSSSIIETLNFLAISAIASRLSLDNVAVVGLSIEGMI